LINRAVDPRVLFLEKDQYLNWTHLSKLINEKEKLLDPNQLTAITFLTIETRNVILVV